MKASEIVAAAAIARPACRAAHPDGEHTCSASLTHVVSDDPYRRPHVFYAFGYPFEWTDDQDDASPSPWPLEFVVAVNKKLNIKRVP